MCGLPVAILEFVVYRDPTECLTAFCFSPFEVRDDSNPSGDGLSHLNRIKLGGAASLTTREINAVIPANPKYLKWSEVPITFNRSDHPNNIPHPGRYP